LIRSSPVHVRNTTRVPTISWTEDASACTSIIACSVLVIMAAEDGTYGRALVAVAIQLAAVPVHWLLGCALNSRRTPKGRSWTAGRTSSARNPSAAIRPFGIVGGELDGLPFTVFDSPGVDARSTRDPREAAYELVAVAQRLVVLASVPA
jgi:hypothetical protein